jgi:hypothetical protein
MRPVFDAIFGSILATDETELWEKSRFASVPTTWGRMPTLVRLMHAAEMPAGTLAYFGEPGVIVHQVRRDRYRDIEGSLDILTNTRRVFDISNSVPRIDPNSQARLGVWDTNMEELFYRRSQLAASKDAESPQPGRGSLITSASELTLNEHSDYKEAYRSMKRDLESGFTLFVPERQFGTEPVLVAWWRVNKVTGEMLGIVADGSGGVASVLPLSVEIPEWLFKLVVSWGMTAAFAAAGYQDCVQATHEERCCAEFAAGWAVVGGLAGIVVTAQVLWELTIMQLYWMELTINGGLGLYGSQKFFNELCQTAIFGDNSNPQDFWPIPESQMAWMESGITGHPKTACLGSVY